MYLYPILDEEARHFKNRLGSKKSLSWLNVSRVQVSMLVSELRLKNQFTPGGGGARL